MIDLGFPVYITRLVDSFLSNRSCSITGFPHSKYFPKHGVPQGSVLGPILFQILVSDLFTDLDLDYKAYYADDMAITVSGSDLKTVKRRLRAALVNIETRSCVLGIDFDAHKTKMMVITMRARCSFAEIPFYSKGLPLEYVKEYKYLGLLIDGRLTFGNCVSMKVQKSRERIAQINRLSLLCSSSRRALYIGYAQSFLYYGIRSIWPFLAEYQRKKIRTVVENGGRLIAGFTRTIFGASLIVKIRTPDDFCSGVMTRSTTPRLLRIHDHQLEVPLFLLISDSGWCSQRKFRMNRIDSPACRFGSASIEDLDHLILQCPAFECP